MPKTSRPTYHRPLTEDEEERLSNDLYDWWKNGNFYVWDEEEVNSFGMKKWEFGDLDFWPIKL